MRFVSLIVEQLDRAASELRTDHAINNRLALILVDNATELLVHRQCSDLLDMHEWYAPLHARYARCVENESSDNLGSSERLHANLLLPKQLKRVKGRSLSDKLKVLNQLGDIASDERRFIDIAHDYRNELYHAGLAHDHIVRAICGCYFKLCCELFARMKHHGVFTITASSDDEYSETLRRYMGMSDSDLHVLNIDRKNLARQLLDSLPADMPDLPATLALSARKFITVLMENLEFVVQNNAQGFDFDQVLEIVQWQRDLTVIFESSGLTDRELLSGDEAQLIGISEELERNWQQQYSAVPHARWRNRSAVIEREQNPLTAMQQFEDLRNEMRNLEEAIEPAVDAVDQWVQNEIDRIRGK